MKEKLEKTAAQRYLSNVPSEKSFWVNQGPIVKGVSDLPKVIRKMKQATFLYHVNKEKNDFAKWIEEVVGDATLAKNIKKSAQKSSMAAAISKRIASLKKAAK